MVTPISSADKSSFSITLNTSLKSTSLRASARITVTEVCPPALPAVPVSIGTNAYKTPPDINARLSS